ncbi:MAG: carbon-nitrogen hydrolase family protein [Gammaproteobacteria bacterium]
MLRAAVIQMVSTANADENLASAGELLRAAAADDAQLAVLPENFTLMGLDDEARLALMEAPGNGPIQTFLSTIARELKLWLVAGTIPLKADAPGHMRPASLLYNPQGDCVSRYDKIHLFDVDVGNGESYRESDTFEAGSDIVVADTEIARIGLSICYDVRFPELYRSMHAKGVELITVPAAFTATTGRVHWQALLQARAVENLCFVLAANQGGTHANGRETWGHSMIIDPWGQILAELDYGAGVVCADLDFDRMHQVRQTFPVLTHRRLNYRLNE